MSYCLLWERCSRRPPRLDGQRITKVQETGRGPWRGSPVRYGPECVSRKPLRQAQDAVRVNWYGQGFTGEALWQARDLRDRCVSPSEARAAWRRLRLSSHPDDDVARGVMSQHVGDCLWSVFERVDTVGDRLDLAGLEELREGVQVVVVHFKLDEPYFD